MSLEPYVRARVRLQRQADAKIFSGWIAAVNGLDVTVDTTDASECEAHDQFYIQAFGPDLCATFGAKLSLKTEGQLLIRMVPPIKYVASSEDARKRIQGVTVKISAAGEPFEARLLDASRGGVGVLSPISLNTGDHVDLEIMTAQGPIKALGDVRYCREEETESDAKIYRIGMRLMSLDRLGLAKWTKVVAEAA